MDSKYGRKDLSTDVLIVGGGIAGLSAAVSIKEYDPDLNVLVVEKQTAGYSGKANKGGGVLQYFDLERIRPEDFVAYHVHSVGCYLGDQELMTKYVSMNHVPARQAGRMGRKTSQKHGRFLLRHPDRPHDRDDRRRFGHHA